MIFGNTLGVSGLPPSIPEEQTTALMQHAWTVFGEDPASGLHRIGWPEFDPSSDSLIRLAYNNSPVPNFVKPDVYAAPCSTIALGASATAT